MDALGLIDSLPVPGLRRCRIERDVAQVTFLGDEEDGRPAGCPPGAVDRVWERVVSMYRTEMYPALQLCIRRSGRVVLDRAIGHARGASPSEARDAERVPATTRTPFCIFSATKPITAMVIHALDEAGLLHLEDRVCDYLPEFGRHGKQGITLRHVLSHRSGLPALSPEQIDLDLLEQPQRVVKMLCEAELRARPGQRLAYQPILGGFVLAEVVRRAAGRDIRSVLEQRVLEPLGLRSLRYGVRRRDVPKVAHASVTGMRMPQPLSGVLRRALGVDLTAAVELSNDPRFLTATIPSANVVGTARDVARFYQCLLDEGAGVFEPRTVRRAQLEQSARELDHAILVPFAWGSGFMLGGERVGPFGRDARRAFGHVGMTNTFTWADPERDLVVALLTNGVPRIGPHLPRLWQWLEEVGQAFPKVSERRAAARRAAA